MTQVLQETLEREMDDAKEIADPARRMEAMITVLGHQIRAVVGCQLIMSERIDSIVAKDEREDAERRGVVFVARCMWIALGALGGLITGGISIWAMLKGVH